MFAGAAISAEDDIVFMLAIGMRRPWIRPYLAIAIATVVVGGCDLLNGALRGNGFSREFTQTN